LKLEFKDPAFFDAPTSVLVWQELSESVIRLPMCWLFPARENAIHVRREERLPESLEPRVVA
jgi:hypothetical protein